MTLVSSCTQNNSPDASQAAYVYRVLVQQRQMAGAQLQLVSC
jgi:hypothetical protein